MKKIALEEHFSGPGFEKYMQDVSAQFDPVVLSSIEELLPEFNEKRLAAMDASGIEISVLSQTAPGVQSESDCAAASKAASVSNEFLVRQVSLHPDRYRGFACVAMQDPSGAVAELERAVRDYGFVGVLVNGQTNGVYLDDKRYWRFWEKLAELDVPLYLHPGNPFDQPHMYEGRPELNGATFSWGCETAAHALRLVFGGVLDNFPKVRIILGHMGETLPFMLWRLDSRIMITPYGKKMKRMPSEIIREHFTITTSGVCANAPLLCSLSEMGQDSVMFSVDYPYEDSLTASKFIDSAPISESVREKVCYRTAERVLKIKLSN